MVALRRPTESSKAGVATTAKSLSAVSLTKKTNSLVSDVEELKNNLEIQAREVTQRDETVQELVGKVPLLVFKRTCFYLC
ncbi:uncharacterized protein KRP23_5965 [Phytophthora ramorum]|uniref:uncharacterized protein n=1 Tax=Phytophthora ramorum TaxID=164328 RepID=UPI0030A8AFC1|nr:hypothetical protein KRP23_5965 [Phytophthora ramorum]